MNSVLIEGLSDETQGALERRASEHGRSVEAEIQAILDAAVAPDAQAGVGSTLAALGRQFGGVDLHVRRGTTPTRPVAFE